MNNNKILMLVLVTFALGVVGCTAKGLNVSTSTNAQEVVALEFDPITADYTTVPTATIELESGEIIKAALFPEIAPNTVNNFITLAQNEFYNGLTFHRVIPNFMIQGGDPLGNGTGNPGYSIKGEFTDNEFENPLKHIKGVLSMARSNDYDSAGSQFFIMQADYSGLDNQYASFGYVIEGLDVVDKIVTVDRDRKDKPIEAIVIKKITIELNGYEVKEIIKVEQ